MRQLAAEIDAAARHTASVLITGESGTGKEVVARLIHAQSQRSGAFVPVDCGALPDTLAEAELFGAARGAYTGALEKAGLCEEAAHGTLFLDELGNASPTLQAKLLRVLQDKTVRRIGSQYTRTLDLRILAATNANLNDHISKGTFRLDLRYRFPIDLTIPPLRERAGDVPLLAAYFLARIDANKHLHPDALAALEHYSYPGNVRELESILLRAAYSSQHNELGLADLRLPLAGPVPTVRVADFWAMAQAYRQRHVTHEDLEKQIRTGLHATAGSYRRLLFYFDLPETDYKRFMDFLRRNSLNVDYRPYRRQHG